MTARRASLSIADLQLSLPFGVTVAPPRYGLDGWLTGSAFTLVACGLVMVASASVAVAEKSTGVPLYYFF